MHVTFGSCSATQLSLLWNESWDSLPFKKKLIFVYFLYCTVKAACWNSTLWIKEITLLVLLVSKLPRNYSRRFCNYYMFYMQWLKGTSNLSFRSRLKCYLYRIINISQTTLLTLKFCYLIITVSTAQYIAIHCSPFTIVLVQI